MNNVERIPVNREMKADDVLWVYDRLEQERITIVVDGGWGVDALLGYQNRFHEDMDIAVDHAHVPRIREIFGAMGWREIPRDDSRECNFVLGDDKGHEVDVHSYTFNEAGENIFGVEYKPTDLTGTGIINGRVVRTIPPEVMVQFHTGYPVDDNDFKDVKALCDKFNLEVPKDYQKWMDLAE